MAYDLFGEVPVTTHDIDAWVAAVAGIEPGSSRAAYYIECWRVVDKIKRAKLDGTFDQLVAGAHPPAQGWWTRFSWVRRT